MTSWILVLPPVEPAKPKRTLAGKGLVALPEESFCVISTLVTTF